MFCGHCGFKNEDGAVFCGNCGERLESSAVNPIPKIEKPVQEIVEEAIPEASARKKKGHLGCILFLIFCYINLINFFIFFFFT